MKKARRDPVVVPGCGSMDDETFFKHLNARHLPDLGMTGELHYSPTLTEGLIGAHRSYHRRLHDIAVPGQHRHEHTEGN